MFFATLSGIPNCEIPIFASGVITLLALKSTRFPIKLPLTRPGFPTSLSLIDFNGLPERCATEATPGILLSTIVAQ